MQLAQAGAGAMRQIVDTFSKGGQQIDQINDLANMTGFSTEKIAGLGYAAKLSGVDIETLDGGLKKLVINLGKAQEAGSPAEQAFRDLGLSAKTLSAIGSDAAFDKIADAISRLPTPAQKAAAAVEIFGKSGINLINVLNESSGGLATFQKEAESLGLVFNKMDAEKVAIAFDAIDKASASLNGAFREMAIVDSPTIRLLSEGFTEFIQEVRNAELGKLFNVTGGGIPLLNVLAEAQDKIAKMDEEAKYAAKPQKILADAMDEVGKSAQKQKDAIDGWTQLEKSLAKEAENRNRIIDQSLTPLEQYRKKVDEIQAAMEKLRKGSLLGFIDQQTAAAQKGQLGQALNRANQAEAQRRQQEFEAGRFGGAIKDIQNFKPPGVQLKEAWGDIEKGLKAGLINFDQAELAKMQAKKAFVESRPDEVRGGDRPGAFLRGSAESFSASFGNRPVDKKTAELVRLNERIARAVEALEKKAGANFQIGA
jgi:hypothetical protein